jgi:hypothetical protein
MSNERLRTVFSFNVMLGAVLAVCAFYIDNRGIADPDIWWHLRNAEYLLKTHHFVRADMYSYTVTGTPWINHEWLTEIPYYLAWRLWGFRGIFVLMVALVEIIILSTYYLGSLVSGNSKAAFLSSWLALFLMTVSFGPRTLLFGWIYLILLLVILWRYKQHGKGSLWLLPVLFLFWVNSHGSWLIGMVVLSIFIVTGLRDISLPGLEGTRWSPAQLKRLLTVTALSLAALFINPYAHKLVFYPFDLAFRQTLNVASIQEWASLDFHTVRGKVLIAATFLVFVLVLVRKQRWRLEWFVLLLFALYSSLSYVRFLFFAGIVLTPVLALRLDMVPPYEKEKDKPIINTVLIVLFIVFMVRTFPTEQSLAEDIAKTYPVRATDYLRSLVQQQPGRIFNDYLWGGYLDMNCRNVPVFIDSRTDIFEYRGVLKDYLDLIHLNNSLEILDKYKIRYLMLATPSPQAYFVNHVPEWHSIYHDEVTTIYEKTAVNK